MCCAHCYTKQDSVQGQPAPPLPPVTLQKTLLLHTPNVQRPGSEARLMSLLLATAANARSLVYNQRSTSNVLGQVVAHPKPSHTKQPNRSSHTLARMQPTQRTTSPAHAACRADNTWTRCDTALHPHAAYDAAAGCMLHLHAATEGRQSQSMQ